MPGEKERNGRFSLLAGNKYFLTLQVGSAVHSHSADNLMGRRTMALDCLNWLQDSAMAHDCGMYLPDVARNARERLRGREGLDGRDAPCPKNMLFLQLHLRHVLKSAVTMSTVIMYII